MMVRPLPCSRNNCNALHGRENRPTEVRKLLFRRVLGARIWTDWSGSKAHNLPPPYTISSRVRSFLKFTEHNSMASLALLPYSCLDVLSSSRVCRSQASSPLGTWQWPLQSWAQTRPCVFTYWRNEDYSESPRAYSSYSSSPNDKANNSVWCPLVISANQRQKKYH